MTGLELKLFRIRKGVKQYHLAAALGMHPSRLSLIESERMPLDDKTAEHAARVLSGTAAAAPNGSGEG